jgi:hypothetical protein
LKGAIESTKLNLQSQDAEVKEKTGRQRALSTENQLMLLLIWMRHYPAEFFLGFLFGCRFF